jgi:phosphonoacetaldehyde hydrolase
MKQTQRLRAIMLDWAGTTVDYGSIAPVLALQSLFAQHGVPLSREDARRDMGLLKRDHIRSILELPNIRKEWKKRTGKEPDEATVHSLFEEFGPLQMKIIGQHSHVIDGVAETVNSWQERGLRIGSTTGYTREMLAPVLNQAAHEGYRPNASVCPDEVGAGRPAPWMLMRNAQLLDVYPPTACVKIGDTISDIEEGRNAGMWTIGLTRTGNMIGLDVSSWEQLPEFEQRFQLKVAEDRMRHAGAHFIAESIPACDHILSVIEQNIAEGITSNL